MMIIIVVVIIIIIIIIIMMIVTTGVMTIIIKTTIMITIRIIATMLECAGTEFKTMVWACRLGTVNAQNVYQSNWQKQI